MAAAAELPELKPTLNFFPEMAFHFASNSFTMGPDARTPLSRHLLRFSSSSP